MPGTPRVLETCLYVEDVDEAADWYAEVLGFTRFAGSPPRDAFLAAGDTMLLLFDPDRTEVPEDNEVPAHGARGPQHVAFGVDDLERWRERLTEQGIEVTHEADWGTGDSIYFEDPHGNVLELVERGTWPVW
jgi:catechol 2,3-dioxygenase-like lactoylglutathione lyase family enzyme